MKIAYRLLLSIALTVAMFALSSVAALACSCVESVTVDREFTSARQVAVLKAVSPLNVKNGLTDDGSVAGFNFRVQRVFKGSVMKVGSEWPMISGGMCSFGFKESDLGEEFLFYYFSDDQVGMVPMCSRSGRLSWRAADILYLEKRHNVRGWTRISGQLQVRSSGSATASVEGLTVRITGQGRDVRLRTDENGVFEVYGLVPGSYRIEPPTIDGVVPTDELARRKSAVFVTLLGKSHVEKNFYY